MNGARVTRPSEEILAAHENSGVLKCRGFASISRFPTASQMSNAEMRPQCTNARSVALRAFHKVIKAFQKVKAEFLAGGGLGELEPNYCLDGTPNWEALPSESGRGTVT